MNTLAPLIFIFMLFVSACASSPQNMATRSTSSMHNYQCQSGETIVATYPTNGSATIQYKGRTFSMQIAVSGSGSRYVGGELEWWTKGSGSKSEGALFRHISDGTTGEGVETCVR